MILSGVYEHTKGYSLWTSCVSITGRDFQKENVDVVIAAETTNCGILKSKDYTSLHDRRLLHDPMNVSINPTNEILKSLDSTHRPQTTTFVSLYKPSA
jgi:hypothetical protein